MTLGINQVIGQHRVQLPARTHAAATATEKVAIWKPVHAVYIKEIYHMPDAAITGVDTNTTHLNILDGGSDGTGTTEKANKDYTKGTDATALTTNSFSITDFSLDAGDTLVLQYEKVGTGLLIPEGWIVIDFEYR